MGKNSYKGGGGDWIYRCQTFFDWDLIFFSKKNRMTFMGDEWKCCHDENYQFEMTSKRHKTNRF